jgi:hypothetical protein
VVDPEIRSCTVSVPFFPSLQPLSTRPDVFFLRSAFQAAELQRTGFDSSSSYEETHPGVVEPEAEAQVQAEAQEAGEAESQTRSPRAPIPTSTSTDIGTDSVAAAATAAEASNSTQAEARHTN